MPADPIRVVLCTCPPDAAPRLAQWTVQRRLAACVNIVPQVRSIYRWQGELEDDTESLLVIKCRAADVPRLTEELSVEHPYDVPEVVALTVDGGSEAYFDWVRESTERGAAGAGTDTTGMDKAASDADGTEAGAP